MLNYKGLIKVSVAIFSLILLSAPLAIAGGDDRDNDRRRKITGTKKDDLLIGSSRNDKIKGRRGNDIIFGLGGNDNLIGGKGDDRILGFRGDDSLIGGPGSDKLRGGSGADLLHGGPKPDTLSGGRGPDAFAYDGDPFDDADVSAPGRQIIGNEDFVTDFSFEEDQVLINAADFGIPGALSFVSIDANEPGAVINQAANVIVLLNSDNDGDPSTPFLAGTAANQIAGLVDQPGPGLFVYFNSNLQLNRLVYSTDLSVATADLKIISRNTDLIGQDAIDGLLDYSADNFAFEGDGIVGDEGDNLLIGFGGDDTLDGQAGNDFLSGRGGSDTLIGGEDQDTFVYVGDPFDGADVSDLGRQIVGEEDFIEDFEFDADVIDLDENDFGIVSGLQFIALDATAVGASIPAGANVIVLLNSDNDNDPNTPFLAGTAATQIANIATADGPGFFIYFNSNLQLNRLVYSTNLKDATADLKILARFTDRIGQDAINALSEFSAENFGL